MIDVKNTRTFSDDEKAKIREAAMKYGRHTITDNNLKKEKECNK